MTRSAVSVVFLFDIYISLTFTLQKREKLSGGETFENLKYVRVKSAAAGPPLRLICLIVNK